MSISAHAQVQPFEAKANEQVLMSEIKTLLDSSSLISGLNEPFKLNSNMPERNRGLIFQQLIDMGKTVRMQGEGQQLQLMIYASNKYNQLDAMLAERILKGELQLYLSDDENNLTQTEVLPFNYTDTIPILMKTDLQSDWSATRFHETNDFPERDRWRDYGQPAIIVAATGITVFLLFNLRSN